MCRIKNILLVFALLMMFACIKAYTPLIESNEANKLVVAGRITNIGGWHEIKISMSSPLDDPEQITVSNCVVNILDDLGNRYTANEVEAGKYQVYIGQENLVPGTAFMISVVTPDGERIESAYDTLFTGPEVDSVYYIIEDVPTSDPEVFLRGLQFYVDLNATGSDSKYYKWEVQETWEHHAARPAEYYYDGTFHQIIPPDYSKMVCWSTSFVKNIYALSTETLSQNVYHKFPLHFIDGHTPRLGVGYSILVTQLALSGNAYNYWKQVSINNTGLGGLYDHQPLAIKGNLVNLSRPEKEVLGYFYTASVSSKRYFYHDIEGLELDFWNGCTEGSLPLTGWLGYQRSDYPVYFYFTYEGALIILSDQCIDCRLNGGTFSKPDFWPQAAGFRPQDE
jgi:hypothetical protein